MNQQRSWTKHGRQETTPTFNLSTSDWLFCWLCKWRRLLLKFIRQNILYQTNLYVTQKHRRVPVVIVNELYAFLGINFLMGYHSLPAIKHYWSNDVDLKVSLVANAMSRNRYQQILANLHVNDNNGMPENNTDKLYKIKPFVDALNNNFMLLYNVNEYISVDKSMKGRKFNEAIQPHEANKTWLQNLGQGRYEWLYV